MALKHAQPLERIDLHTSVAAHGAEISTSLLRTPHLQLLRLVLAAGHSMAQHHVPGEITIQCISGEADITASAGVCRLLAGSLVMIPAAEPHGVFAPVDTVLLVTLLHL